VGLEEAATMNECGRGVTTIATMGSSPCGGARRRHRGPLFGPIARDKNIVSNDRAERERESANRRDPSRAARRLREGTSAGRGRRAKRSASRACGELESPRWSIGASQAAHAGHRGRMFGDLAPRASTSR